MAHIRDVRKLNAVALAAVVLLMVWYLMLRLQITANFEWFLPRNALETMGFVAWGWVILLLLGFFALVAGLLVFSIPVDAESGRAIGGVRQVQCMDCRAVFRITDNGARPLTHSCPSCKAYGVYDGTIPPVGEAPVPQGLREVKKLDLTCRNCAHKFHVTDTGARPLTVSCPDCQSVGTIR